MVYKLFYDFFEAKKSQLWVDVCADTYLFFVIYTIYIEGWLLPENIEFSSQMRIHTYIWSNKMKMDKGVF